MALVRTKILTEGIRSRNGAGFLIPLYRNYSRLKDLGIEIQFLSISARMRRVEGDCVVIESQGIRRPYTENRDLLIENLRRLKERTDRLILFDLNDDSTTGFFDLLPHVDKYCKAYVLRDRSLYKRTFYGGRLWTDFYHSLDGIKDDSEYRSSPVVDDEDLNKIVVGYLLGLVNYSGNNPFIGNQRCLELLRKIGALKLAYGRAAIGDFTEPSATRFNAVSCRIATEYPRQRNTITYQRKQLAKLLEGYVSLEKISSKAFNAELRKSKIVISPFGWGELNVARDYEAAYAGTVLLKPNIQHMETFPDIFSDKAIIQFKWDLSDVRNRVEEVLSRYDGYLNVAKALQEAYRYYMCDRDGAAEFCEHFRRLIEERRCTS